MNATIKLATQRFVWPSIKSDCRKWTRSCLACQKSKITRHNWTPVGNFAPPSARFDHIHIDLVGPLPISDGFRFCLTCVDRFSRWPEAVPLENMEAETVARALYSTWITRFGTPLRITTDQGRQFESDLFRQLTNFLGTNRLRTTSYHPSSNGLAERLHRQLKAAIRCHATERWTEVLPTILFGIRAAWREDLQASTAEMLYGQTLRLPGEFFAPKPSEHFSSETDFVSDLRRNFNDLRPVEGTRHGGRTPFVFKDLASCKQVFLRTNASKGSLVPPYTGPYTVISRNSKTAMLSVRGAEVTYSLDRLKPAYTFEVDEENTPPSTLTLHFHQPSNVTVRPSTLPLDSAPAKMTRSGRHVRFPAHLLQYSS